MKMLVIEDNIDNLDLAQYLLQSHGHEVLRAVNGTEGVEGAKQGVAGVLCDIQLPDISGYEVLAQIRENQGRTLPVIALTAYAMRGDHDAAIRAGFDGYISKPIDPETFVARVEKLLSEPQSIISLRFPRVDQPASKIKLDSKAMVMVVDDKKENRDLMRITLESSGYAVVTEGDSRKVIHRAKELHPDLIITDLHMPHLDGHALHAAWLADWNLRDIPVIMITSSSDPSGFDGQDMKVKGVANYVTRPLDPSAVMQLVEKALKVKQP